MRIAFLWKWWSWKSTTSTSFAQYLHSINKKTLFIDADININWLDILGYDLDNFAYLSDNQSKISDYVYGQRNDIPKENFLWVTPPCELSKFIKFDDDFFQTLIQRGKNNLPAMWIWWYNQDDVGFNCYHGKSDWFITFLNHFLDRDDEYIVIDSVTWIDNSSTPLAYSYNLNVIVVEPTKKSLWVYFDFIKALEKNNIHTQVCVIWNKIESIDDENFIRDSIWNTPYIWSISFSQYMMKYDQWDNNAFNNFVEENSELFEKILLHAHNQKFDYNKYYSYMFNYFSLVCDSFYNTYFEKKLQSNIKNNIDFNSIRNNELSKY
jgi:CO dehydrogenase nickel-insertion accessory protein CooC1